ncbi:M50 family metallopeptidase [Staphylococcus hominis]|uniref:M50 family metallopeptidase n=1 Tax=Staphylococcus hominis TaxID=1290 RepID=UPI00287973B0|nr:M50 family metallopeptidase [Staphylococcus hominis]MDS3918865.1 M50 family metallopeptidase [Staphylococcus hominis]
MKKIVINSFYNVLFYEFLFVILFITAYITKFDTLILISNLLLISILVIVIHELGHFFMGKLNGMSLHMISLFIFLFVNNKIYFSYPIFLAFGITKMYQEYWTKKIRINNLIWYVLGGPIFNFIAIVIISLFKIFFESFYLDVFQIMNFIILIVTSLPIIEGNDGHTVLKLIKEQKKSNFYRSYLKNSMYLSDKVNIYNYKELFFKLADTFSWNIIYLHGLINDEVINQSMKKEYHNKYEENIINLYLTCLGFKSNQEFNLESITPIYGNCLYYLKNYLQYSELKYLDLANKNLYLLLDNYQIEIIKVIIKRYKEGYDEK